MSILSSGFRIPLAAPEGKEEDVDALILEASTICRIAGVKCFVQKLNDEYLIYEGRSYLLFELIFRADSENEYFLVFGDRLKKMIEAFGQITILLESKHPSVTPKPVHRDMSFEEKLRTPFSQLE